MQHDFNLADQTGILFRQDLNNAIQALVTKSSNASEPETKFPFQWWTDTSGSTPILKIRNAANDAWIIIGPISESFGLKTSQPLSAAPTSPSPFQWWTDTSGSTPILKIRNAANDAWISVGQIATNFGLLPLVGGTLTGALNSSNKDYWKVPVGTTAERPTTAVDGMLRYNSTMSTFEGYRSGAWGPIGGGAGGGSGAIWQPLAGSGPIQDFEFDEKVFQFEKGAAQSLILWLKVPSSYISSKQILMKLGHYSPSNSNNFLFQTLSTLVRKNTDASDSTTNQYASTNADVVNTVSKQLREVTYDITNSIGQINGVSVSAGDLIKVKLTRVTTTGTDDVDLIRMVPSLTEVLFS